MYEKYNLLKNASTKSNNDNPGGEKIFDYNPNNKYSEMDIMNDSLNADYKSYYEEVNKNKYHAKDNEYQMTNYKNENEESPISYDNQNTSNKDQYNNTKNKNPVNEINNEDSYYINELTKYRKFALNEIESAE